jgi:hypothetical protein
MARAPSTGQRFASHPVPDRRGGDLQGSEAQFESDKVAGLIHDLPVITQRAHHGPEVVQKTRKRARCVRDRKGGCLRWRPIPVLVGSAILVMLAGNRGFATR